MRCLKDLSIKLCLLGMLVLSYPVCIWAAGDAYTNDAPLAERLVGDRDDENDLFKRAPWSVGAGIGYIIFEGDQKVKDNFYIPLTLSYDLSPRWTLEGEFNAMPDLKARSFDDPNRHGLSNNTWGLRLGVNALYHLRNVKNLHWDPFLLASVGVVYYDDKVNNDNFEGNIMGGAGIFYHFNDAWALRGDVKIALVGSGHNEFNTLAALGVNYRWGTTVASSYEVTGGDIDSDNDGLTDKMEVKYGTNPYDPDTDKDGLTDGEEVNVYHTDPLNPDSDWDGLTDGAEVLVYHTNPLNQDTDGGGVSDGHEVIEDHTNPLDPKDDLQLFRLNIEYDYDKAVIKTQYYGQLDAVIKVLRRDPGATAKVEGHCDKWPTSEHEYNAKLSDRRAHGVVEYIVKVGGIEESRLSHKGYSYDKPIAPNNNPTNRAKNRRTDIYIRPSASAGASHVVKAKETKTEVAPSKKVPVSAPSGVEAVPVKK